MGINNNYTKAIVGFTVAVSSVPVFAPVDTKAATFSDVPDAAYYADAVRELAERGIVNGFGDGTFKPDQQATRGQTAKILAYILGLDTENVLDPGFTDLLPSDPFYGAIAALAQAGIINGYEDRTFRMNEPIQRNHLAKMLVKAFHLQTKENVTLPFTDVHAAYQDYVLALYTNGITTGRTATQFDGESYVTRGQLAAFVVRTETAIQSNTELPPPTEPLPEPTLTYTVAIEGMEEIFLPNQEYEVITSAVIGKVYVEGDVVKITFVSEEVIPKEAFKATINNIEYELEFSQHENTWIVKKIEDIVLSVPVTDISLNTTTSTLYKGNTTQLTASIFPSNATNQQVTWTSSNPMVASVDTAGLVNAVRQGTAIITATTVDGHKTATATIHVVSKPTIGPIPKPTPAPSPSPVSVTSITLNQPSSNLAVGETSTFIATIAPSNATNKNVTWSSSDETVATVDATGKVTAIGEGTATITATTVDGLKTATALIDVFVPVTSIALNPTSGPLAVGETTTLMATVAPSNATNQNVIWTSSNENVATVDAAGIVYAVAPGNATITATTVDGLKTATALIDVFIPVTSITLNPTNHRLTVGETSTLMATVAPSNATNQNVTWSSSDETVATVDAAGNVTAIDGGTATITATTVDGLKTATALIDVFVPVTNITLNPTSHRLAVGKTTTLTVTIAPSNATNQNVTWSSSNENVATVDTAGIVYAVAPGNVTITATTLDGLKTATALIDVVVPVTDIKLNKTSENLDVGATTTLTATVTPSNATNQNITWTSSNENVAMVASGVVNAVAPGIATITATTIDGQHTASYIVTVNPTVSISGAIQIGNTLTADALTPTGATVTYQWQRLKSDGTYEDITGATNNTYTLVSGDENRSIRVVVTANDSSYSETVTSNPITAIAKLVGVKFEQPTGTPFQKNQTTPQNYLLTFNILDTVQVSNLKIEFSTISLVSDIDRHFNQARASFGSNLNGLRLYYPEIPTPNYLIYYFAPNSTLKGTYTIWVYNGIAQTADSTSGTIKIWVNDILYETMEFGLQ